MRIIILLCTVLSLGFASCDSGEDKIKELEWMLGTWEGMDVNDLVFVESWNRGVGNSFVGKGATITPDGDTLFKETLKIELVEGTPYYVATVPENPGPVLFKLVEGDATHAVFENLDHDFPQRISYTLETKSTMSVKLEGVENGIPRSESLNFEKNTGISLLPGKRDTNLGFEIIIDSAAVQMQLDSIKDTSEKK